MKLIDMILNILMYLGLSGVLLCSLIVIKDSSDLCAILPPIDTRTAHIWCTVAVAPSIVEMHLKILFIRLGVII